MTTSATEATERSAPETGVSRRSSGDRVRALPGGVAGLAVVALLWVVSGPIGLIGGGVLLVAWAVLPATYAFAVGQVAFVAVTRPDGLLDVGLLPLALVELGLVGVLVGPALRSARGRRTAVWTLLGAAALTGVALASYALWDRVWLAAGVLVGFGALGTYGLHRYELVVLGKVPDPDEERSDRNNDGFDLDDGHSAPGDRGGETA